MDFGAVTAKKFSNGYGVPGKSAYDGVFTSPVKFRAPSLASSFQDYCEIFGGSEASIGSSIPVLEVPELNDTKNLLDVQRSKLEYSKVFGGLGNLDTAVPYEELFAESKKKDSFPNGASSQDKEGNLSSKEDSSNCSKQVPLVSQETSYGAKKINMSYHKTNQGRENRKNGTTHIAQLHAVPAYTCLIEEVNPLKTNRDDQSVPELQHAYPGSDYAGGMKEKEYCTESVNDLSPDSSTKESSKGGIRFHDRSDSINMVFGASEVTYGNDSSKKQSSDSGIKVQERSDSISMFLNACEVNHGSDGTDYIKEPKFQTMVGNLDDHGQAVRSVAAQCQVSASEAAAGADSSGHLDDMIDLSSEAAASVAALRKAIEEAQERLNIAKDLMKRKKEGFPNRTKRRFNNDLKAEGKKEEKFVHQTMRHEGTCLGQTCGEMDVLPRKSSVTGKPMPRKEQVTLDLRVKEMFVAKEAVRGPEKLESTVAGHSKEEEVAHKEVAHEETLFEPKDAENNEEVLHTVDDYHGYEKNAGKNAFEKQESHMTVEVVKGPCEPEANEEKVNVDDEAGHYGDLVDKKMFMCEELLDDTKLAQETLDSGAEDKNLKVEDEPVSDDKVAPFLEQEGSERMIGNEGLSIEDEEKIKCKSENEKKVEGPCEQEECSRKLRDHQEFIELKKNVTQEGIGSEEKVESFSRLKGFELREDTNSVLNGKPFNIHDSDVIGMERQMDNWSFLEEEKTMEKVVLLALNQETEHHYQREGNENRLGNIHMQEILEGILGHADDEERFHEVMTNDSDSDRNEPVEDAKEDEMEINGAIYLTEETEKHSREPVKIYEEKKTEEADRTAEISPNNGLDCDNLSKIEAAADTTVECDKIPEVTPEECSLSEQDEILVGSHASTQHEEKCNKPGSLQVISILGEKLELTSTLTQGALQLNEAMNQMQHANETVSFDSAATNIGDPHDKFEQNSSDCWKEDEDNRNLAMPVEETSPELGDVFKYMKEDEDGLKAKIDEDDRNLATPVEETSPELGDVFKYMKEDEDGLKAKIDENQCNSSSEEILVDNESNMEAFQPPLMPEQKCSTLDYQEIDQAHSNLKKNYEAALTMEEKKADETSHKTERDTDHLKKNEGAKEKQREREREKEKIAVERAIREARERAFAEARERATLERAAAEARRKNVSDGRERLVKMTGQANEKTSTERAAMEAKLKAERAAVERATAEARARALERALSEKAASELRNKSDKFFTEKSFGASRDNGVKANFHSKSFSYGDTFDGANGDSAQRCKARSERHQRIGERVAKALAEKNARDRLVQKEQEERNRVAEALDGDVKRWSSGKEGNLRALLSTLQYILGPDSGWQPIHLTDIVNTKAVRKAYRKATLFVHPDKLQQRGASIQQKYICEKVFDLLKEAWNKFNMEER